MGYETPEEVEKDVQEKLKKLEKQVDKTLTLSNLSLVIGLVPGGTVPSILIAGTDLIVNDHISPLSGSLSAGLTEVTLNDNLSDHGKKALNGKTKAIIWASSQATGWIMGN